MCICACVCVWIYCAAVISCMLFYTLLGISSQSHEQHIAISPNAAYKDINKVNTNINPAYGEMRETTRQQHATYEEIII